jgi:hypothetical protein
MTLGVGVERSGMKGVWEGRVGIVCVGSGVADGIGTGEVADPLQEVMRS